jgi:hypothetical protein
MCLRAQPGLAGQLRRYFENRPTQAEELLGFVWISWRLRGFRYDEPIAGTGIPTSGIVSALNAFILAVTEMPFRSRAYSETYFEWSLTSDSQRRTRDPR